MLDGDTGYHNKLRTPSPKSPDEEKKKAEDFDEEYFFAYST